MTWIDRIWARIQERPGRGFRFLRFQTQLWPMVNRRVWKHNALAMSAALSYQTIFAMIPLLVLLVLVLKSAGVIEDSKVGLREFLAKAGISQIYVEENTKQGTRPASLSDKIEGLYDVIETKMTVARLGPVGVILLIWGAIALLTTMEQSLNRIFGISRNRSIPKRMFLYWSTITLVPLIFLAVVYLSRHAMEATKNIWGVSWILAHSVIWLGTPVVGILVLGALYKYLPNTAMPYRTAFMGAVVAGPLWMVARWGFGLYVTRAATSNLYGALGLVPVFLIWLNLSWLIFLLGAELAYTAANLKRLESAQEDENIILGPPELLGTAVAVGRAFAAGSGAVSLEQISRVLGLPDITLERILERLRLAGIVVRVEEEEGVTFVLARPADKIGILEILDLTPPTGPGGPQPRFNEEIEKGIQQVITRTQTSLKGMTLAQIITP
jgi:membrane protein